MEGNLPIDGQGVPAQLVNTSNWRHKRFDLTTTDWTLIDMGDEPYSSLMFQSEGPSRVILCNSNNASTAIASNNPAHAGYGMVLYPDVPLPALFTKNVKFYAKVKTGGSNTTITVSAGW